MFRTGTTLSPLVEALCIRTEEEIYVRERKYETAELISGKEIVM